MTPRSFPAPLASVRTPKPLSCASPSQPACVAPPYPAPCSFESSPPRTPDSYSESCNTNYSLFVLHYSLLATPHSVHARSTHSRRCKSYTSSAPSQDAQAISESSAYSGIPSSTAPCAQSSQASYPSLGSPPCYYAVVLQRAYPYHFNASNSAKILLHNNLIRRQPIHAIQVFWLQPTRRLVFIQVQRFRQQRAKIAMHS